MTITINIESSLSDNAKALIQGSEESLREVYTEEECFTFTADELNISKIDFFVARKDNHAIGCVALLNEKNYGEIKRLFILKQFQGNGYAKVLIHALEEHAYKQSHRMIYLETGVKLKAAVALYQKLGYHVCSKFGEYNDHPASLFMKKELIECF